MSRKAYFTGESYLGSTAKISPFDTFEGGLNFRTLQPSGLLFYHSEGVHTQLCLLDVVWIKLDYRFCIMLTFKLLVKKIYFW